MGRDTEHQTVHRPVRMTWTSSPLILKPIPSRDLRPGSTHVASSSGTSGSRKAEVDVHRSALERMAGNRTRREMVLRQYRAGRA